MLQLDESLYIGHGSHKKCYLHPQDRSRCVKVIFRRSGIREMRREIRCRALLERRGYDTSVLPRYYGTVQTQFGEGFLYETMLDSDGGLSRSLRSFLLDGDRLEENLPMLAGALGELRNGLVDAGIAVMGLNADNIVLQEAGGRYRARLIDNIGTASFIPLEYCCLWFARMRMRRRWKRFMGKVAREFPSPAAARLAGKLA